MEHIKDWIKSHKLIILVFMLTNISFTAKAQDDYLDYYSFFGLHSSLNYYPKANVYFDESDSPVTMQYNKLASGSFGVMFQIPRTVFISSNNIDLPIVFQIGFNVRHIHQSINFQIDQSQLTSNDSRIHTDFSYNMYTIPITEEILITDKFFFHTSLVPGFFHELSSTSYAKRDDIEITTNLSSLSSDDKLFSIYFNLEAGFGLFIPTSQVLFQPYLYFNFGIGDLVNGHFFIEGIKDRDYSIIQGSFIQHNMFIGFGLNVFPKRFW